MLGVKGDPLNLSVTEDVVANTDDRTNWNFGKNKKTPDGAKGKKEKLSSIGHGQVPFTGNDAALAAVSFSRITQRATLSFAQLRRISLRRESSGDSDAAMRALLVALGLYAHQLAFGRGFALRSGAELRPAETVLTWLGESGDEEFEFQDADATLALLESARSHAEATGVPLDGWGRSPTNLLPKENLRKAIQSTWEISD